MKRKFAIFILVIMIASACAANAPATSPLITPFPDATLVLTNAIVIDGTGADPVSNAEIIIGGQHILYVGSATQVTYPPEVKVIDLDGAYVLPGFINAHVHDAYDEIRLEAWAQSGVTTVRDEAIISGPGQLDQLITLRNQLASSPKLARLISAGYMLAVPGGYGSGFGALEVTSIDNALQHVNRELDAGVELIKLTMESGYAGVTNLPVFSSDELNAIVSAAHARGKLVTAHITEAKYLPQLLEAGVDDLAHIPSGFLLEAQIEELIDLKVYVVPTLTVFEAYGGLQGASNNLRKFAEMGVKIAMGNDYTAIPQNGFDHFELGVPMHEINRMSEAGMTPMQIIVASTLNAAHVCGLEGETGSLEAGKDADILAVNADPLQDLSALTQVKMVIHYGEIIRQ